MTDRRADLLVLVADGDEEVARALVPQLLEHGVTSMVCTDGADALLQAGRMHPDVLLVAADLPVLGGPTLVGVLRRRLATPVLIGVGAGDAAAAIEALAAGANACVTRPYRLAEVLPLVRSAQGSRADGPSVLELGGLRLDRAAHEVRLHGAVLRMPPKELELLAYLMWHHDRVVPHEEIRDQVWGPEHGGTNTVVVHVRRLRARLGDAVGEPRILLTVRGVGYRLVAPPLPVGTS